jgi:hypothetical protein
MHSTPATRRNLAFAATLLLAGFPAAGQTLYKLIDKNGKVTYSESAPKDFNGKVIRMDVNPNANTATLPKYEAPAPRAAGQARPSAGRIEELKERLETRRAALATARNNPGEGDVRFIGNAGGGTRAVPSERYQRRLDDLEREIKETEDELRQAQSGR